ncbi:NAD+ diphosphatase [Burkholderiaceae bacterium]|nr:NAD+ diphosphatase [Burkholderiaceae bacterium]
MSFVPAVLPMHPPTPTAWCFAFVGKQLLVPDALELALLPHPVTLFEARAHSRHYLGRLSDLDCWALGFDEAPAGWRAVPLRAAMTQFGSPLMMVAGRAAQVLEWDRAHRFCGACGTPMVLLPHERARRCPGCGLVAYPRVSPAMMALVWRGRELLLARSPGYAPGVFSALAGFVEAGESLEECVHREVAEEVGVKVANLRYYGSQSWPFPHSLMVAYTAEWVGGEIVPQADEIEAAAWFAIDDLPAIPPPFSIAGHLIRDAVANLRGEPAAG